MQHHVTLRNAVPWSETPAAQHHAVHYHGGKHCVVELYVMYYNIVQHQSTRLESDDCLLTTLALYLYMWLQVRIVQVR